METTIREPFDDIEERLAKLRRVRPRENERFSQGRAAFLAQARQMKAASRGRYGNNDWASRLPRRLGFAPMMTVVVVLVLVFGGAGMTAYAAQDSLPADALYPVKTLTEDLELGLSAHDQSRLDLALTFAERRVSEMSALAGIGAGAPTSVANRMGAKVEAALIIAAGLEGEAQQEALGQILTHMEAQAQLLAGLEAQRPDDAVLAAARTRLLEQLRLAALGLSNPAALQQQLLERARTRAWEVPVLGGAGAGNENDTGAGNGGASGNANSNANTNQAANDNGNGNEDCANCNESDDDTNAHTGNVNSSANGNDDSGHDDNANGSDHGDDDENDNGSSGNENTGDEDDRDENGNDHSGSDDGDRGNDHDGGHDGSDNDSGHDGGDDHGDGENPDS